jgi:hypothetical protein
MDRGGWPVESLAEAHHFRLPISGYANDRGSLDLKRVEVGVQFVRPVGGGYDPMVPDGNPLAVQPLQGWPSNRIHLAHFRPSPEDAPPPS